MNISYSAVQDWRKCQQLWSYRYQQQLEPLVDSPAPTLGRILHRYLELYYANPDGLADRRLRHQAAWELTDAQFGTELVGMGNAAYAAGQTETAELMFGLADRARLLADRYFRVRGIHDDYEVLAAEHWVEFPLAPGIVTPTRIDLLTRDADGMVWLWEHKTLGEIPPQTRRMKDLQTLLYAVLVEEAMGIHVDGVVWNYIRTKLPTVPRALKLGGLSRDSRLDTTWETYLAEIQRLGLDPADYAEEQARLAGRETTNFFVRVNTMLYQSERVLLRDFITSAQTIKAVRESGATFMPVRTIAQHCDWCPFSRLCEAAVTGGDESDLVRRFYRQRRSDNGRDSDIAVAAVTSIEDSW